MLLRDLLEDSIKRAEKSVVKMKLALSGLKDRRSHQFKMHQEAKRELQNFRVSVSRGFLKLWRLSFAYFWLLPTVEKIKKKTCKLQ